MLLLEDGRVAAQGTHQDLLASSAAYRDVLASWASAEEDDDLIEGAADDSDIEDPLAAGVLARHDPATVSQAEIRANAKVVGDDLTVGTHVHEPIGGE